MRRRRRRRKRRRRMRRRRRIRRRRRRRGGGGGREEEWGGEGGREEWGGGGKELSENPNINTTFQNCQEDSATIQHVWLVQAAHLFKVITPSAQPSRIGYKMWTVKGKSNTVLWQAYNNWSTVCNNRPGTVMLDKTINEAYSVHAALPNSHTICSTTSKKLQKYTDLTIWQLSAVYIVPLSLSTMGIISKKFTTARNRSFFIWSIHSHPESSNT